MSKRGDLIFWEISEFSTSKERLIELGFEELMPRNDYRTAAVKAIRKLTKGGDKMYRKFNDTSKSVSFGVFLENTTDEDIALNREMIVHVDKRTGKVTIPTGDVAARETFHDEYHIAKETIDASQIRTLIMRIVRRECFGFGMRKSGGIYFIDERFMGTMGKLEKLFAAFQESCRLHRVPIYDDPGTQEAIEHAASEDISSEIDVIIRRVQEGMKKGTLTRRGLDGQVSVANEIFAKIKVHEDNLRSRLEEIQGKVLKVKEVFGRVMDDAGKIALDPEDFMSALGEL